MSIFSIPSNIPFRQRSDTMFLDTIHITDTPLGKILPPKPFSLSLTTSDIDRASTYLPSTHLSKPSFYSNSDIEGSSTNTIYREINNNRRPRDLSLTTEDIEFARPKITRFNTKRCTDTLNPTYTLPTCNPRPITPPSYNGRPTNYIDDIEESRPRRVIPDRNYVKDPNNSADIPYSTPSYYRRVKKPVESSLTDPLYIKDINNGYQRQSNPRGSNPLDPTYTLSSSTPFTTSLHAHWSDESIHTPPITHSTSTTSIGYIEKSKPRHLTWQVLPLHNPLITSDIPLANPQRFIGSTPFNIYSTTQEKPVSVLAYTTKDIPGAVSSSLKKGITTRRCLDPQNPQYKILGGKEKEIKFLNFGFRGQNTMAQKMDKLIRSASEQKL